MTNDPRCTTTEEEEALTLGFGQAEPVDDSLLAPADLEVEPRGRGRELAMTDPGWSEFVLGHFDESELDASGKPLVHGLRRVARLLLGPILESRARVVQAPQLLGGFEQTTMLQPATVEYTVVILMCRLEQGLTEAYPMKFSDCADVYFGNTDPDYARHPTATAATRAEARCLRKALQLKNVAAEEVTHLPLAEAALDGLITPTQVNFLDVLCARNNINVLKFVNSGKKRYDNVEAVPYGVAQKMVEHLSSLQNDPSQVPEAVKGYDKKWRQ